MLEIRIHHFLELDMREHDISGGFVIIIEKNSVRDRERDISRIGICRAFDLEFIVGSRKCGGHVSRVTSWI